MPLTDDFFRHTNIVHAADAIIFMLYAAFASCRRFFMMPRHFIYAYFATPRPRFFESFSSLSLIFRAILRAHDYYAIDASAAIFAPYAFAAMLMPLYLSPLFDADAMMMPMMLTPLPSRAAALRLLPCARCFAATPCFRRRHCYQLCCFRRRRFSPLRHAAFFAATR